MNRKVRFKMTMQIKCRLQWNKFYKVSIASGRYVLLDLLCFAIFYFFYTRNLQFKAEEVCLNPHMVSETETTRVRERETHMSPWINENCIHPFDFLCFSISVLFCYSFFFCGIETISFVIYFAYKTERQNLLKWCKRSRKYVRFFFWKSQTHSRSLFSWYWSTASSEWESFDYENDNNGPFECNKFSTK